MPTLRRVINATGTVLHTNLGRAPLAQAAIDAIAEVAGGASTLEYDLEKGARGSRSVHVKAQLRRLCGTENALVVNNCAAAVLLALTAHAQGREVIVSRGELVEIGGAFRVPDVMAAGGAILREVGTTNRTRISDYERAITSSTALLLKVHRSNFSMQGFTEEVEIGDLARLAHARGILAFLDLGSGALDPALGEIGTREPGVQALAKSGVDLLMFSGDKLLGGPQAGIVVGSDAAVSACARHPLMRALRPGKLTLAALGATLSLYDDPERARREIPTLAFLHATRETLLPRAEALALEIRNAAPSLDVQAAEATSQVGGGALPGLELPTACVRLRHPRRGPDAFAAQLRRAVTPIIARVAEDAVWLDLRTIAAHEISEVIAATKEAADSLDASLASN